MKKKQSKVNNFELKHIMTSRRGTNFCYYVAKRSSKIMRNGTVRHYDEQTSRQLRRSMHRLLYVVTRQKLIWTCSFNCSRLEFAGKWHRLLDCLLLHLNGDTLQSFACGIGASASLANGGREHVCGLKALCHSVGRPRDFALYHTGKAFLHQ